MKQLYHVGGYQTFDLTECKLHRLEKDGKVHFVACYPKKWDTGDPVEMPTQKGPVTLRSYLVTEWEEVELEVKQ
jgi:hypothetical protein